ncbi:hypothetical protein FQN54_001681 [Arachnomyces sp. PD_36]|nr:hypothetical protein FQN54_001681 [Arachnomyces sp. PD_36]
MTSRGLSIDQLVTRSLREKEQQDRVRKAEAASSRDSFAQPEKQKPEPVYSVVVSSNGSIVNNAGDDLTSSDPHAIERPLSTGAIPDSGRFKDLSIQESPPAKSKKRKNQHSLRGGKRDVFLKRESTDPDFDRGHLHSGSKSALFEPAVDDSLRPKPRRNTANDHDASTGTVTKWPDHPDPRIATSGHFPQHQGWNSPQILKKEPSMSPDIHGHNHPALGPGQGQPPEPSGTSKWAILPEPETRPISEDQLVKEVRGIYAGLVMVEKKCIEIDQQQAQLIKKHLEEGGVLEKLTKEQWQALIAMHRTLLHEHHDFFLASQHPSASPSLQRLPQKYVMPARMWRHGIHSFLEILRQRLPDSLEHMLTFIYLTYSMMTLLVESVPTFKDTWIECLGDLARYRMAVEEVNFQDREVWAGVARYWYNEAADRDPNTGRIQHHLAVLARSNVLQQLFFYTKSLICVQPFPNTTDSMRQLFNSTYKMEHHRVHPVMTTFTDIQRTLFSRGPVQSLIGSVDEFIPYLDNQIGRVGAKWREQGVYIASTSFAAILGFGNPENNLLGLLRETFQDRHQILDKARRYWVSPPEFQTLETSQLETPTSGQELLPVDISPLASRFAFYTLGSVIQRTGDKNIIPYVHVSLAFLWSLALVPESMRYIESDVPWAAIERFLNTLARQGTSELRIQDEGFPRSGTILPEDYLTRGQIWAEFYYPEKFFDDSSLDIDERPLELPSIAVPRAERCLWLGARLSSFKRWLTYNPENKLFSTTKFALQLENEAKAKCPFGRQPRSPPPEPIKNVKMVDVGAR